MTASEIAKQLGAPIEGDGGREILSGNSLERARESEIAFAEGDEREKAAGESCAGCLLVRPGVGGLDGRTLIRVPKPRNSFARVLRWLHPEAAPVPGVHPTAIVAESAELDQGVSVGPHAVIGEGARIGRNTQLSAQVKIGERSTLGAECRVHPGVAVSHDVAIGDRVTLHAGAVIGADGFGFAFEDDHYEKFPQTGTVEIGNDVEIGANSCVDRAALEKTVIGDGAKLDNLVHIGHSCRIGRHVVIAAQTGLSGGVVVEDYVVMGGQVGIGERAHIGKRAVVGGQCGILPHRRIEPGATVWGTPSRPHGEYLRKLALFGRLPKLVAELKALGKRIAALEPRK